MPKAADTSLGRKILKTLAVVLGCLLGLILLATIALLTFLEPYLERKLKEQVASRTEGLYSLRFEDLDLDLFATTLLITDLHLYPDSSVHRSQKEEGTASATLFEVKTPLFKIAQVDLVDALLNKKLDIGTIHIEKPEVNVLHDKQVKTTEQKGSNALPDFLNSFLIREINIPDATYRHFILDEQRALRHLVPRLSLRIVDLTLDSLNQKDYQRPFKAEDIQLSVKDYAFISPDSVYKIHAGLLTYSTKTETLEAKALLLNADHKTNKALPQQEANRSIYTVKAPRLLIEGLDLIEVYRSKKLEVREILLQSAFVAILENKNIPAKNEFPALSDLYRNVSPFLTEIQVEKLRIADGALIYRNLIDSIEIIHELKKTDLSLQEVRLDSATLFKPGEDFYAEEMILDTKGYTYQHPHSPYTIKVSSLRLTTIEDYLQADSIQVIGNWNKNEQLRQIGKAHYMIYDISAPGVRFNDFDIIEALKTKSLEISSIVVEEPKVKLLRDQLVEKAAYTNWQKSTFQDISGFITELTIGAISLQNASFTHYVKDQNIQLRQKLDEASLLATGLRVDSTFIYQTDALIPLQELKLTAVDYTYWLPDDTHFFHLGSLAYSTRTETLRARLIEVVSNRKANNKLKPAAEASRELYDLEASLFKVTGLDLIAAINKGRLALDEVLLLQPEVAVYRDRDVEKQQKKEEQQAAVQGIFSLVSPVTVNTLRLEDGTFVLREKRDEIIRTQLLEHFSARLKGIYLDRDELAKLDETLPVEEVSFTASDYTYRSPNGVYTITLDSLEYSSTEQLLTARIFKVDADVEAHSKLQAQNPAEASRNLFDVYTRKFRATGLNLVKAYETGWFTIDHMLLVEPEVTIIQDQNIQKQQQKPEEEPGATTESKALKQVADIVETFKVEHLQIQDGIFKINVLKDTIRRSQTIKLVSVNMEELKLASLQASDPLEMFSVEEVEVLVRDYTYLLPDSLYRLEIDMLRTSLRRQSLVIDSLRLIPLYDKEEFNSRLAYESDRYTLFVPEIQLLGIDLSTLFNQQDFIVDKAIVLNPDLNIYRDRRMPEDPNRQPGTLQDALLEANLYVKVDTTKIISGEITYLEVPPTGEEPALLLFEEIFITISNITNDSVLIQKQPLAIADAVALFMGKSKLSVLFTFHLDDPNDYHTYEGSLKPMDFEAFNPLVKNLMAVRIERGFINGAEFSVEATEHMAEGRMRFLYENLQVALIDRKNHQKQGFLKKAGSWLLNTLVIKSNNPGRFGNYRKGPIKTERDYQKSIFSQMSSAMVDGIASSLMPDLVEKIVAAFTDIP